MSENSKTNQEKWVDEQSSQEFDSQLLDKIWQSTAAYKADYQADVESGLHSLKTKLRRETAARRLPASRPWPRLLRAVAAAAVLVAASVFAFHALREEPSNLLATTGDDTTESLSLQDGSFVTLNAGSTLAYPPAFPGKERRVSLEGEAFFEVKKEAGRKFVVETSEVTIEVLGTSFGVLDSRQSPLTEVYVHSGRVAVSINGSAARVELSAGERLRYDENTKRASVEKKDLANTLGWRDGLLRFNNASLAEILAVVERQFGQRFDVQGLELSGCPFTLAIEREKLDESLAIISRLCPVEFQAAGPGHYVVSGECCK